jgi:uncharacterized protein (UPF0261 family)
MASVTDVAGINSISARILANAAGAMAGMVNAPAISFSGTKPLVAATMFGVTTPCVTAARQDLEQRGYEVLVFHATGNVVTLHMLSVTLYLTTNNIGGRCRVLI